MSDRIGDALRLARRTEGKPGFDLSADTPVRAGGVEGRTPNVDDLGLIAYKSTGPGGWQDMLGYMPTDSKVEAFRPSIAENLGKGEYLNAAMQAGSLVPFVGGAVKGAGRLARMLSGRFADGGDVPQKSGVDHALDIAAKALRGGAQSYGIDPDKIPSARQAVEALLPADPYEGAGRMANAAAQGRYGDALAEGYASLPQTGAIKAYHGSPHQFDRFDISKIGTGEGAQAYGHGLYFAGNEDVASSYKHSVSGRQASHSFDGAPLQSSRDFWAAQDKLNAEGNWRLAKLLNEYMNSNEPDIALRLRQMKDWHSSDPAMAQAVDELSKRVSSDVPKGHMYEVNLDVEPHQLLDWDKPLSEQPKAVQDYLHRSGLVDFEKNIGPSSSGEIRDLGWTQNAHALSGEKFYRRLTEGKFTPEMFASGTSKSAAQAEATKALRDAGIPGIQYLDSGSRAAGDGSRNYVMFDDKPVSILRRYAQGGDVPYFAQDRDAEISDAMRLAREHNAEPVMRAYEPSLRDKLGSALYDMTSRSPAAQRAVEGLVGSRGLGSTGASVADFVPGAGQVLQAGDAYQSRDPHAMAMAVVPMPGANAAEAAAARALTKQGLYSRAAEAASALPQVKGSYEQMMAMLRKAGVKPEELKWSGVDQAFAGRPNVTRDELAQHFSKSLPQIEETVRGGGRPKFPEADRPHLESALSTLNANAKFLPRHMIGQDGIDLEAVMPKDIAHWRNQGVISEDEARALTGEINSKFGGNMPPKFTEYAIPGGENYRELLMRRPVSGLTPAEASELDSLYAKENAGTMGRDEIARFQKLIDKRKTAPVYQSNHWDEPNVLAHLRMSDRPLPEGGKGLHLEELQSDWAQDARKRGFRDDQEARLADLVRQREEMTRQSLAHPEDLTLIDRLNGVHDRIREIGVSDPGPPSGPYVGNTQHWTDLALKRALREAAEGGYDRMMWTPGAEQARRYDIGHALDHVRWSPETGILAAMNKDNNYVLDEVVPRERVSDYIGKELADRLMATEPAQRDPGGYVYHTLSGEDLHLGGEGMRGYYDKIVPTQLSKLLRGIDPEARIGTYDLPIGFQHELRGRRMGDVYSSRDAAEEALGELVPTTARNVDIVPATTTLHSVDISPAMREAILRGFPAYAKGGDVHNAIEGALRIANTH